MGGTGAVQGYAKIALLRFRTSVFNA